MILDEDEIKDKDLRKLYSTDGAVTAGLPQDQIGRLKKALLHLQEARSLDDLATGLGAQKNFHKLKGHDHRYALDITGNFRIAFDCENPATGIVTNIWYGDYH